MSEPNFDAHFDRQLHAHLADEDAWADLCERMADEAGADLDRREGDTWDRYLVSAADNDRNPEDASFRESWLLSETERRALDWQESAP